MPATTPRQQRYMAMLAHDPAKRRAAGVPQKVAEEFSRKPAGGYRRAMTRSTRSSPPFTEAELAQGYRRLG